MSNMKNGLSTLNRWLGKKNKAEKDGPNGKLSKSSTNLSVYASATNINETTQLEYNQITPLPVATTNTLFEQTFRITVLLPKDQLYVARLGARVPLSKLLELVSENKLLDADKYEFRNPVDPSQVYSCELSIGAVGLSEIRLCLKSDPYNAMYSTDEVIKLHRTSAMRDSLSSSEFSGRNSKHTTKTPSPYSSSNSLNSMDSTGVNYTRTPVAPPATSSAPTPTATMQKLLAPPRKKRAAPRPPSQKVIPEKSDLIIENGEAQYNTRATATGTGTTPESTLPRKDYFVSTPNLTVATLQHSSDNGRPDCNGNTKLPVLSRAVTENGHTTEGSYEDEHVAQNNARNLYSGSVQSLASAPMNRVHTLPEPSPRKRLVQQKKKTVAPAPPPRGSMNSEDALSIASTTLSTPDVDSDIPDTPNNPQTVDVVPDFGAAQQKPVLSVVSAMSEAEDAVNSNPPRPAARDRVSSTASALRTPSTTPVLNTEAPAVGTKAELVPTTPKPVPRQTTLNLSSFSSSTTSTQQQQHNVSKVMLNRTPTPEPRSLSCEPPDMLEHDLSQPNSNNTTCEDDDSFSKQADSGIGEPVPSPTPDSLPSESSAHEFKSTFEATSSDDDDMVKVYNFKLGKTLIQPVGEGKTIEDLKILTSAQTDSGEETPVMLTHEPTPNLSETTSWNFSIPISPPPNFADNNKGLESDKVPDTPITPKIKERPVLNFDSFSADQTSTADHRAAKDLVPIEQSRAIERTPSSPTSPLNDLVDELSTILHENRMDSLIRKAEEHDEIHAAKPNNLSNFSITAISQHSNTKSRDTLIIEVEKRCNATAGVGADEEQLYRKRDSFTNTNNVHIKQRKSITRADSFHTTNQAPKSTALVDATAVPALNGLNSRSSSYMSLTKLEQSDRMNRRRSSSELSIGESPSLQSLEIIKTILNSRKNSLANSSDSESKVVIEEVVNPAESVPVEAPKLRSVEPKPKCEEFTGASQSTEVESPKGNQVPKVYRYSGPPSINFGTWNERPKVKIAIKNEGDYIFGGKDADSPNAAVTNAAMEIHTHSVPRNYRASTPAGTFKDCELSDVAGRPPAVAPKPSKITHRMGIPEKEFKVPITVKPIKDVVVEHVNGEEIDPNTQLKTSAKVTTVRLNGAPGKQTPETVAHRPYSQSTHTATLPRIGAANRFSTPVANHSSLTRSISITQLEAQKPKSTQAEATVAPFGQNTLRKTGLKEKILAAEKEDHSAKPSAAASSVAISNGNATKPPTSPQKALPNGSAHKSTAYITHNTAAPMPTNKSRTMQSAKLELKLSKPTMAFVGQSGRPRSPAGTQTLTAATPTAPPAPAPKAVTPTPPPAPAFLRSVSAKPKSVSTTPVNEDPRNQLLEAIRSFKRDGLKSN